MALPPLLSLPVMEVRLSKEGESWHVFGAASEDIFHLAWGGSCWHSEHSLPVDHVSASWIVNGAQVPLAQCILFSNFSRLL